MFNGDRPEIKSVFHSFKHGMVEESRWTHAIYDINFWLFIISSAGSEAETPSVLQSAIN